MYTAVLFKVHYMEKNEMGLVQEHYCILLYSTFILDFSYIFL